jgi:hypothetical protein
MNTRYQKKQSTKKEKNNQLDKKLNPEREKEKKKKRKRKGTKEQEEKECYSKDNILLWTCEKNTLTHERCLDYHIANINE